MRTRADRLTAIVTTSGLDGSAGGVDFAFIATTFFFAGAAAFFFARLGALRRAAAATAFLRAGLRALLARFFPAFLRLAAGLARRTLLRFFAAMIVSPTW
jgi:hypothetical protein